MFVILCSNGYAVVRDSYRALLFDSSHVPRTHGLTPFPVMRLVTSWVVVVICVAGLTLIAFRSRATRRFWPPALLTFAAITVARIGITVWEHYWLIAHPEPSSPLTHTAVRVLVWPYTLLSQVFAAAMLVAWYFYWTTSERVASTFELPGDPGRTSIEHVAIWVRDLETMRWFYTATLGGTSGQMYENATTGFKSYFISLGDGPRLELMYRPGLAPWTNDMAGQGHIALVLGGRPAVDDAIIRLRQRGVTIADEPRVTGDGYYEAVILDPERNRIELTA